MAENPQPEIPQEMRELALQNIDQARAACSQLMDAAQKAPEMMIKRVSCEGALVASIAVSNRKAA